MFLWLHLMCLEYKGILKQSQDFPANMKSREALKLIFRKNSQVIPTANHSFQFQPEKSMGKKTDLSSIRTASLHLSL